MNELNDLINSLTRGEKRYISIKFNENTDKHALLYKKYNSSNPLKLKAPEKHFIIRHILRYLMEFRQSKKDAEERVFDLIAQSKVLVQKRLIKQSQKKIKKATELAESNEYFSLIMQILNHRESLLKYKLKDLSTIQMEVENISNLRMNVLEKVDQVQRIQDYNNKFEIHIQHSGFVFNEIQKREMEKAYELIIKERPLSKTAGILIKRFSYMYFFWIHKNVLNAYSEACDLLELADKFPSWKENNIIEYIQSLQRTINFGYNLNKNEEVEEKMIELKNLFEGKHPLSFPGIKTFIFKPLISAQSHRMFYKKDFSEISVLVEQINDGVSAGEINEELFFDHVTLSNVAMLLMIAHDWQQAVTWFYKVLNLKTKNRPDIIRNTRINLLICLYELEDLTFFESQYKSSMRYFSLMKDDRYFEIELINALNMLHLNKSNSSKDDTYNNLATKTAKYINGNPDLMAHFSLSFSYFCAKSKGVSIGSILCDYTIKDLINEYNK
jgi:hypothetical protein